jgi:hypothetical protein
MPRIKRWLALLSTLQAASKARWNTGLYLMFR